MLSLSEDAQSDVIEAFNSTSSLSGWPNIDNNFFDSMVNRMYPSELQLNSCLDLPANLRIGNMVLVRNVQ